VLDEWLQQKSIGAGIGRARARREDADDEDEDVVRLRVRLELAAQGETIDLRDEDLAHDEVGPVRAHLRQRFVPVGCELDPMARLDEEVSSERANVRVSLDDEDGELL
jgi:hypothetical protein